MYVCTYYVCITCSCECACVWVVLYHYQRRQKKMKSGGAKWRAQSACCRYLINIHDYSCSETFVYARVQWNSTCSNGNKWWPSIYRLIPLCREALTNCYTTTGYCTTCKYIAFLLLFISLFIACDVTGALKWWNSASFFWKVGRGARPPCPLSLTPMIIIVPIFITKRNFEMI